MYLHYLLMVLSVFLFLHGFFPVTTPPADFKNEPPEYTSQAIANASLNPEVYASDIRRTVLIVIDALRLDFIDKMPLTSRLMTMNGCFNTIVVETPTVTLPRIKALTSGNVPQFVDLVFNLASTEVLQDSLIHSLAKIGRRIVFYGDDTWLKLFPNSFMRYEGTNSFFVRDFKEVDDNVTRNVYDELKRDDWDMMILHYLGLDHIGHVYGPFSTHVPDKLKEMDEIIYEVYWKLSLMNEKFLLVITGDHGMRDSGGHGGASYSETHVPLIVMGVKCDNGTLLQIDVPVNLAVLLDVNIPSTSIGQLRSNLLVSIPLQKYMLGLRYNTLLLLRKSALCKDQFELATQFHETYLTSFDKEHAFKAIDFYKNCSDSISKYLITSSVKQNLYSLIVSILSMYKVLLSLIRNSVTGSTAINFKEYILYIVIVSLQFTTIDPIFSAGFIVVLIILSILNSISFCKIIDTFGETDNILKLLIVITAVHPLTFLSSSFVEEEHQYWYFFSNFLMMYVVLSKVKGMKDFFIWFGLLSALRFLRTINSTGDKWASYPDFSDWLLKDDNYYYYQLFFVFGLGTITYCTSYLLKNSDKDKVSIRNGILLCVFLLKNMDYLNVLLGKLAWVLIFCHFILCNCPKVVSWVLISSLLLKPYNVYLISFCILASVSISKIFRDTTVITLCHVLLSNMLYFAQGHSNSLASVDVSVGYIGLSEHQPVLVIIQVLCHTYCFPVLCHFLVLSNKNMDRKKVWIVLFCNRLYVTMAVCIITVIFRHHLFIWSVFAPKLFIESICLLFLFIEFNIYFCFEHGKLLLPKYLLIFQ